MATTHAARGETSTGAERYIKQEKLGEGTYGVVYKALDTVAQEVVALKKVRVDAWDEGIPATALREIAVLKEIGHDNIVGLRDVYISPGGNLYLVFELLDLDLKQYLDRTRGHRVPADLVKWYLHQMLSAAEICHAHRIIHRDLKPQNILLAKDGRLKLADFGLARAYNVPLQTYTHEVVTLWYRAPEILLGSKKYSTPIDVWSAGCIFAEMFTGAPLFPGDSEIDELYKIFQVLGTPNERVWKGVSKLPDYSTQFPNWPRVGLARCLPGMCKEGLDLLTKMLVYDPAQRITAADALRHPYFADLKQILKRVCPEKRAPSSVPAAPATAPAGAAAPHATAVGGAAAAAEADMEAVEEESTTNNQSGPTAAGTAVDYYS